MIEEALRIASIEAVVIERTPLGFRTVTRPKFAALKFTSVGHSPASFMEVCGSAVNTAAELGVLLEDKTGRLSKEDCELVVESFLSKKVQSFA